IRRPITQQAERMAEVAREDSRLEAYDLVP
ncbi:unnamed protein product, partial [marine sediment metagenome]